MTQIIIRSIFVLFLLLIAIALVGYGEGERVEAARIGRRATTPPAPDKKPGEPAFRPPARTSKHAQSAPTFSNEIVRIMQKNCQTCHHPGDIAPFSMMTYKETRPWAQSIREQVILRKMPPWKPAPGCGDFKDARGLSEQEIRTIVAWVDAGAPEGNQSDLPAPLEFPDGWPLGAPDLIVSPESDYTPPTQGDMYRCFSAPVSGLRGDRWISALSVKPGNPRIVHHVIVYPDPTGVSAQLDANDPQPGYTCFGGPGFDSVDLLGGWAPGSRGYFAPDGAGIKLANNARVVIQVHYHPTGQKETDRTPVGLYFAKSPVNKQLQVLPLVNQSFAIPPGAKNYEVTASYTIPTFLSGQMWAVTPHMHLLGKKIKVEVTRPGTTQPDCLINIEDWNFNWQGTYLYQNAVELSGGSRLKLTTIYDNSTDNPLNPNNPPRTVRWGEETTDEMSLAFVGFTLNGANLPISTPLISDITIDNSGALIVNGTGFLAGAEIEINGRSLRDTTAETATQSNRLSSSELWKVYAAPGQTVSVAALNPDGVHTPAKTFIRQGTARSLAAVSAANYSPDSLAPDSIAAAFGTNLATNLMVADVTPLPTNLAGTSVRVNGTLAPLFFVSPTQVNFLIPSETLTGGAVVEIVSGDTTLSRGAINLSSAAPSLFTSNAQGTGAPAAVATKDGVNFYLVGNADGSPNPTDPGDYLILFGSGIRKSPIGLMKITIGGVEAAVLYAGAQGGFAGLDQINTQIPTGISGVVDVVVSVNGKTANVVQARIR
jgi:uncharacterized protein (TIGR03437 family)